MGITQQIGASSLIKPGVIDNTAARPASPFEGQVIFQKDTDQLLVWNGTAWVIPNAPAQNPTGLEFISSTTLSSATQNLDGIFDSKYDNYKIVFSNVNSVGGPLFVKLRSGGSTTAGGYYSGLTMTSWAAATSAQARNNSSDGWYVSYLNGTNYPCGGSIDIYNPYKSSTRTHFSLSGNFWDGGVAGGGYHLDTTQFDGISLLNTNSMNGTISVYGYRK